MAAVLVVEECAQVRWVAALLLRKEGYAVEQAAGGPEALARFRPGAFALAVIDVGMRGMSGPQTLAALRALDPALPCVLMSGGGYAPADMLALGADHFLAKPFKPDELLAVVSRLAGPAG